MAEDLKPTEKDFKPIETQEELNRLITSRLERAKESVKKEYEEKYKDYDAYKNQIEILSNDKTNLENQLNDLNEKVSAFDALDAKTKKLELENLKIKIALSEGIPFEMAGRLTGETEEEIKKDAKAMANFVSVSKPMPSKSTEQKQKAVGEEAYRKLVEGLKKGE